MATILTSKQEMFCQLYVSGLNASESYREAYGSKAKPESVHRMAKEVLDNVKVSSRIQELRDDLEEKALWKRLDSIRTLSEIASGQDPEGKTSDRVNAVRAINSMHGWDAPVKLDHKSSDGSMSPSSVDKSIVESLAKKLTE